MGGDLPADREHLKALRELQLEVKMFDESAEEVVKEAQRTHVEAHLQQALDKLKVCWMVPCAAHCTVCRRNELRERD